MNIYQAIMRAADHIEARPELFDFYAGNVPECDSPACAVGWIGHFAGMPAWTDHTDSTRALFGLDHWVWIERVFGRQWGDPGTRTADKVPGLLRAYANKYHADQKPDIPADIRALFEQTVEDPDKVAA